MNSHFRLRGPLVLVVDDDLILIDVVKRLLTQAGLRVVTAGSGAQARSLTQYFEVGVFDIELGRESGVDLAEELLASGRVARALFFTGGATEEQLQRAERVAPVLSKGEHPSRLIDLVHNLIQVARSSESGSTG